MKQPQPAPSIARFFSPARTFFCRLLRDELGLRCVTPEGAFYTMVDVSEYGDEMKVAEAGLEQGVVTIPAAAFGDESKGYLRISFCADEERLERRRAAIGRGAEIFAMTLRHCERPVSRLLIRLEAGYRPPKIC